MAFHITVFTKKIFRSLLIPDLSGSFRYLGTGVTSRTWILKSMDVMITKQIKSTAFLCKFRNCFYIKLLHTKCGFAIKLALRIFFNLIDGVYFLNRKDEKRYCGWNRKIARIIAYSSLSNNITAFILCFGDQMILLLFFNVYICEN